MVFSSLEVGVRRDVEVQGSLTDRFGQVEGELRSFQSFRREGQACALPCVGVGVVMADRDMCGVLEERNGN